MQQNPRTYKSGVSPVALTAKKRDTWVGEVQPTQGLIEVVATFISKSITVKEFDGDIAPAISGMVVEFDDRAEIYVNRNLNFCWRRFVVAKELSHLLLNFNNGDYRTIGISETENLVLALVTDSPPDNNLPLLSEHLAYIAAIELLMPQELAQKAFPLSSNVRTLDIAHQFKCPEQVIRYRNNNALNQAFQSAYQTPKYQNAILSERSRRANKPKAP